MLKKKLPLRYNELLADITRELSTFFILVLLTACGLVDNYNYSYTLYNYSFIEVLLQTTFS